MSNSVFLPKSLLERLNSDKNDTITPPTISCMLCSRYNITYNVKESELYTSSSKSTTEILPAKK